MAGPRKEDRSSLVWQSQLPSQRQAKEGIAMKKVHVVQPPSKTRETVVKQYIRAVRGLSVTFFVLSVCLAAAGALAQQSGGREVKEAREVSELKKVTWQFWTRALVRIP